MTKAKPRTKKNTSGEVSIIHDITLPRIPFSVSVDQKMRTKGGHLKVTPNLLARLGFCLSLEEPGVPPNPFESEGEGRVINRGTLLGENDAVFLALFRTWIYHNFSHDEIDQDRFNALFIAHMNRGFELISSRMKTLTDLSNLFGRLSA